MIKNIPYHVIYFIDIFWEKIEVVPLIQFNINIFLLAIYNSFLYYKYITSFFFSFQFFIFYLAF